MPSKSGPKLSPTTTTDGLFFNAFEDPEPTTTASSSTNLVTPNWQDEVVKTPRKSKSSLRRRVSETAPSSSNRNGELRVPARPLGHSRSQTDQGGSPHSHPLGNATASQDATAGHPGSTRPHLSRIMSFLESPADSDVEGERKTTSSDAGSFLDEVVPGQKDNEKTVLVHEVSPKDSLAGVALKYGITMGELRKANHLWASDSIHLRKVLYIPFDGPSHPNGLKPLIDLEEPTSTSPSDPYHGISHTSTIRRVPASQLSFFPPPSKPSAPPSAGSDEPFYNQDSYASSLPSFKRVGAGSGSGSPAQPSRALSSILTAFPIAASTRDTIIARLSFDSERNSISDDQEHELDEVRTSSLAERPSLRPSPSRDEMNRRTSPSSRSHPRSRLVSSPKFAPRSISPPTPVDHRRSWTHTDATKQHTAIRTAQLEPSPAMRVPSFTAKPKPRQNELVGFEAGELGARN